MRLLPSLTGRMLSALIVSLHSSMSLKLLYTLLYILKAAAEAIQPLWLLYCIAIAKRVAERQIPYVLFVHLSQNHTYSICFQKYPCVSHERPSSRLLHSNFSTQLSHNLKVESVCSAFQL